MAQPTIKELLGQVERAGRRLEGLLRALELVLQEAEARGETAVSRDPVLGPELPDGEGIAGEISAGIQDQDNRSKAIYEATKSEPVDDVAYAFHITHQRVHQIIKEERWKEMRGGPRG